MSSPIAGISFVCAIVVSVACSAVGEVSSVPRQQQHLPELDGAAGIGAALWSAVTGCLGPASNGPAAECFKSKALTFLDRTLAKPAVAIANGVSLSCRTDRSLQPDHSLAAEADRAALNATDDPDRKNALLDRMIADRLDALVSTRTIVLHDGSVGQEAGRGRKKQQKTMRQAFMMVGLVAVAILVPMAFTFVAFFTAKALLVSKIALIASSILAFKKLLQPSNSSAGGDHKIEIVPEPHYVAHEPDAHNTAYSSYAK